MSSNSMVWSDEEAKYLRALLTFDPNKNEEAKRKSIVKEEKQPVGEFRILVVGAKGCGKTSIVTKVLKLSRPR
jgi:GTPase SAR1 family protein